MLLWQQAVTDRSQSDVKRVLELLEKGWQNFSDDEKSEWNGGLKGALNVSDWLRIQSNVSLLKEVLELDFEVFKLGKNLLNNTATTKTVNGVTFTVNDDGSVTVNGTATDTIWYTVGHINLQAGDYVINGCPSTGSTSTYRLIAYLIGTSKSMANYSGDRAFTFTDDEESNGISLRLQIQIYKGYTVNNLTFYPMIRLASIDSDIYEPYSGRNIFAPTESVYEELLSNVEEIRNAHIVYSTTPLVPVHPLNTYQKWNEIERILSDVYTILLNNFNYYCGSEIYAGDETGLLL